MCGRFAQQRPAAELAERFAAEPLADELGARYNVAPTDAALVVVQREDRRAITAYRWGLIPHWATSPAFGARTFNARSETVATTPAFRDSFRRRRCIVPVDAFYEWRRDGRVRKPFAFRRADGDILELAGLWSGWREPDSGEIRRTFTIVTVPAAGVVADLHDRMPARIAPEDRDAWLDPAFEDSAALMAMLLRGPDPSLACHPVGRGVNDVRRDGPELLEPVADPLGPVADPPGSATDRPETAPLPWASDG
jgi:putative SOS response-associated peptidase YedK